MGGTVERVNGIGRRPGPRKWQHNKCDRKKRRLESKQHKSERKNTNEACRSYLYFTSVSFSPTSPHLAGLSTKVWLPRASLAYESILSEPRFFFGGLNGV